jgi:hypothetical protein
MTTRIDETNSRGYRILGMLHRMWSRLKCLRVQEMRPTGSDGFQSLFNGAGSKWMFECLRCWKLCVLLHESSDHTCVVGIEASGTSSVLQSNRTTHRRLTVDRYI